MFGQPSCGRLCFLVGSRSIKIFGVRSKEVSHSPHLGEQHPPIKAAPPHLALMNAEASFLRVPAATRTPQHLGVECSVQ